MSNPTVAKSYIRLDRLAIGARLRSERQRLGFTQGEIARRVGLKSKSAIKNYEKGQIPGPQMLSRLATLFGRSIDWLLSGGGKGGGRGAGGGGGGAGARCFSASGG